MSISTLALLAGLMLGGCSADLDQLQQWLDQQRRQVNPNIAPLLPPKEFLPQAYEGGSGLDPFNVQKLAFAANQEAGLQNSLLSAELKRQREPLELFPLDSMTMVGSLEQQNQRYGLLRVDQLLYRVSAGNYLGQNFGRVTAISETSISLREVVQDAAGEWVERSSTLQLQEKGR